MYVPFDVLPDESRIWIYQSDRKFSHEEVAEIEVSLQSFLSQWQAHGNMVEASYQIEYNRFIIIAINQEVQEPTGCSIDESVRCIQGLEKKYQVNLLDRMNVSYKIGEHVAHKSLLEFKQMIKQKAVSKEVIVFDNLVNTIAEWRDYWEIPAMESWYARFF